MTENLQEQSNTVVGIRNFVIIAHIDHGKSTLADRFLEITGTIEKRKMREQFLDSMELERERGITIKLQPVRMNYRGYLLNLIDTPGHVDFSYEVSRSLAAVEGALLVVDASQGVQAQTLANLRLAQEQGLKIIPVINKIDLPQAQPARVAEEIKNLLGVSEDKILKVSAKEGRGAEAVLQEIIKEVPPPQGSAERPLRALIFDSIFDPYRGVVVYLKVVDGVMTPGLKFKLLAAGIEGESLEVGFFAPALTKADKLENGEIGYAATGFKDAAQFRVGDTLTAAEAKVRPLPGYKAIQPFVYASLFPVSAQDLPALRKALAKLKLNDAALSSEPEHNTALGPGFRCGFLGLLHLEIVRERLEREFQLELLVASPSVRYEALLRSGERKIIQSPMDLPHQTSYRSLSEPWVKVQIITPSEFLGAIFGLAQERGGIQRELKYLDKERALLVYEMPLRLTIVDFYDQLKSVSAGLASLSYEPIGWREGDLVRLDFLAAGELLGPLSLIVGRQGVRPLAKNLLARLKKLIPRQSFEVALQASVEGKIVARETLSALRKDVLAKLYGGDRTRKDKLLKKQRLGKKRLKQIGGVALPSDVFISLIKHS